jgi:hypothetical protein
VEKLRIVYFIQTAALEKVRGLNLNKCYPVHDEGSFPIV